MAPRLPGLIVLLIAALPLRALAQAGDAAPFARLISAEMLRKAGVIRLAEILRLLDDWDATTQDEFLWGAVPSGAPPSAPRWLVLVDGQRMELDLFGVSSLERLPIPLETIERVEVDRTPVLAAGELATAGVIHIHTRDPQQGVSAAGLVTTGSEIGDPGPFAFTPLATPNVDRIGNDASARLGYGANRWFADAGLRVGKHNSTDPAIVDRFTAATDEEGRVRSTLLAPFVRLGIRLPTGQHTLSFRHSRTREYLPLEPVAGELAVLERYSHLGLHGTFGPAGSKSLRYSASWSDNRAEQRRAALPTPFAWRAVTLTTGAEAVAPGSHARVTVGARVRHVRAEAPQSIERDRLTFGTLYGEIAVRAPRLGAPTVAAELSASGGEVGGAAALRSEWRRGADQTVDLSVSYAHRVHATDNSLWAWSERGYSLLDESRVATTLTGPLMRPGQLGLDVGIRSALTPWSWIRLEGFWRRHHNLALVERTLSLHPVDRSFGGPADVATGGGGQVAGGLLTAQARVTRLAFRISYRFQHPLGSDDRFRTGLATVPRHRFRYLLEVSPAAGLDLWSMLEYRSATHWREFEPIETQTSSAYRARVPASVGLDVALQKWLWHRRLRAHLGFRNVLGSTIRYHPAGSTLEPRMYVQVEGRVP